MTTRTSSRWLLLRPLHLRHGIHENPGEMVSGMRGAIPGRLEPAVPARAGHRSTSGTAAPANHSAAATPACSARANPPATLPPAERLVIPTSDGTLAVVSPSSSCTSIAAAFGLPSISFGQAPRLRLILPPRARIILMPMNGDSPATPHSRQKKFGCHLVLPFVLTRNDAGDCRSLR